MFETGKVEQNKQLAKINPSLLLRGDNPRLIDEWQVAPGLWDSIRFENEGIVTLQSLAGKIGTTKMMKPSFLMVLTAVGSYAYRNELGVYIVPISCLKD